MKESFKLISEYLENPIILNKKTKAKWKSPAIFDQTSIVKRRAFTRLESWESVDDDYLRSSSACNDSKDRKKAMPNRSHHISISHKTKGPMFLNTLANNQNIEQKMLKWMMKIN